MNARRVSVLLLAVAACSVAATANADWRAMPETVGARGAVASAAEPASPIPTPTEGVAGAAPRERSTDIQSGATGRPEAKPGRAAQPGSDEGSLATEEPTEEVAVLDTSRGTMVFRLFEAAAPLTTANFKALVAEGFYDGLPFYRVVKGHVIQAGDGGENGRPTVKGEFGAHPHVTGALGLARDADPDSGSTEIYVCHAPRPHLDGRYAVFGLLIEGFDVLEAIGNVDVEERWDGEVAFHRPIEPVVIERARLERRPVAAGS